MYENIINTITPILKKYQIKQFKIYPGQLNGISKNNNDYIFIYDTNNDQLNTLDGLVEFESELIKALNHNLILIDQYTLDYSIRSSARKLKTKINKDAILIYESVSE